MAYRCGDCRYFEKSSCSDPRVDKDHTPCRDFEAK